eukprot:TRINITY_DN19665_c0_g1_i1.p1 TRINITY_DN19665_c0_g1~~TRINITY_DN19665_c0_g1_i1.p1  ORF type:complete len:624 (-),score=107.13 TRINITY_DN19665_c0_g1_i1:12-1883(-)
MKFGPQCCLATVFILFTCSRAGASIIRSKSVAVAEAGANSSVLLQLNGRAPKPERLQFLQVGATTKHRLASAELCSVATGYQILPENTCADFATGHLLSLAEKKSQNKECLATLRLFAQQGETEAAQLMVSAAGTLGNSKGGLHKIRGTLHNVPKNVVCDLYQVGFVLTNSSSREQGSGGGWRPDPLVKLSSDGTFDVTGDASQPLWVSCAVGADATPGVADMELKLSVAGKGHICASVLLEIWDLKLPSLAESRIGAAWQGSWEPKTFEPYYGTGYWEKHNRSWYDLLLAHRTPPDAHKKHPRPVDEYAYLASQGMHTKGLADASKYLHKQGECSRYSKTGVSRLIRALRPAVEELEKRGILDGAYVYGFDEQPQSCARDIKRVFAAVKEHFPRVKTMAALNWKHMPSDMPLDIWVLQYQLFDSEEAAKWTSVPGKQQWHYHCIEPSGLDYLNSFIERPPVQARLLFWLAALNELKHQSPTGWLYYKTNLWRPCNSKKCGGAQVPKPLRRLPHRSFENTAFTEFPVANYIWQGTYDDMFANGDGMFVYPCENGPCSSMRLESIRDGLEDWELFRRLGPAAVPLLEQVVSGPQEWDADPHLVESIRRQAAEQLMEKLRSDARK